MILCSALDAEMKDATMAGVALQNKRAEKLPVVVSQLSNCLIQYMFITESFSVSARPRHCWNPALHSEMAPRKMEKGPI